MATDPRVELAKAYDPKHIEDAIYRKWEDSGFFNPDTLPGERGNPFSIIMPPPNANGALHIGHAVFVTLQDILIRFWRMRGRKALWLPGADHAGFETQVVFDKKLEKEGRNRFQIPRNQLWQEMWEFTQENKVVMENQLRKLGASADWSREKFTLDPDIVAVVTDTFKKLYKDDLLYRGERIVNWCVKHQTTLSDLEIKYEERADPLYHMRYGPLVLATVRPETKFGDTAVAVHPKDKRYAKYVGKELEIETLIGPAKIKVIADEAVDPKFGTGVVKVTPAHDPDDFEIGKRHNLEVRPVIGKDGRLNERAGPYAGLKVAEARERVVADLQARGLLAKIEPEYKHNVAVCYKCGNVVEPLVMPQWFVRMAPLAEKAIAAVRAKEVQIIPDRYKKVYLHWLKNIRDWNISRQITWGIRIPAWFCIGCGEVRMDAPIRGNWYFVRHGETDWNAERRVQGHSDVPLNDRGREQARQAAIALKESGATIDAVITSDLQRARETGEIIARELGGVEVISDTAFRERNWGDFEGANYDDIRARLMPERDPHEIPGGEALNEFEERVAQAFERHRNHHMHRNIVIVSHGGAIRALLARLKNISWNELRATPVHNASILHFSVTHPCPRCGVDMVEQDPDVLDTWFSSGQWPFATLLAQRGNSKSETRNPKSPWTTKDFETFYPTDVMETGYDILFFWVSRMIMLGLYRTGQPPFRTVYLHGLVRDKDRQKMSKSKGNVIDPLGVAAEYGTDAVRMALVVGNLPGNDIIISEEKIRGYRNFANKLWNIHRFLMMRYDPALADVRPKLSAEDRRRQKEAAALAKRITADLEKFRFHHAAEALYHYAWHTFADQLIEAAKPRLDPAGPAADRAAAQATLFGIYGTLLKLLHPFMPFITEALWQDLPASLRRMSTSAEAPLLLVESWPVPERVRT
ncbi:hypothetical protein C4552_01420 [Candidatus Parcubacteria bacterium]|nr:MAG: hypothetical protein C4552_01420 [Candidatus Parcubacteria bacterium]